MFEKHMCVLGQSETMIINVINRKQYRIFRLFFYFFYLAEKKARELLS